MEGILSNAVSILVVGMITVLLILWMVVVVGNVLILLTNKFWPLPEGKGTEGGNRTVTANKMAAIVAAVQMYTGGKGKITKIEKE
jgi:oxaloacetate decarboxylase gamma subunit